MEMTFRRDAKDRQLTFENVAKETGHGVDLVELLVRILALPEVKKALVKAEQCTYKPQLMRVVLLPALIALCK